MLSWVGRARLGLCRRQAFANVRDVNESPVLALAGLAAIGLLATRLPPVRWRHATSFDLVLATGGPLVLFGLVLEPGSEPIEPPIQPIASAVTGASAARTGRL